MSCRTKLNARTTRNDCIYIPRGSTLFSEIGLVKTWLGGDQKQMISLQKSHTLNSTPDLCTR